MSSSGNFSVSREHLKEKALHAPFSSRRHANLSKLKAAFTCKIFDTMISPILTYNSEIWGVCAKPDGRLTNREGTPSILQTILGAKQQSF